MSIVQTARVDGIPVARVTADIDAATAATVHERLAGALDPDTDCLIVDLSETRYLDSAGLDMLLRLNERLSHRRVTLMLVIPESSHVNRLATIVGLPQTVAVHSTLLAAQDACAKLPRDAPVADGAEQREAPAAERAWP
jgi:anti-anti-sigma factor